MEAGLERWLRIWGFETNPFAYREAGSDPYLSRYFVAPEYFDEVLGDPDRPQTAVVFAPRGGGKTALRRMVDYHCREGLMKKPVLSVLYTDFSQILEAVNYDLKLITPRLHAFEIINCVVLALVEWLVKHLDALNSLNKGEKVHLEWYLSAFGAYLIPEQVDALVHGGVKFQQPLWKRPLGFIQDGMPGHIEGVLRERSALSPARLLSELTDLIQTLGFEAIYVLVDRVDEIPFTAAAPEAMIGLLKPLMADLTLMNLHKVAFKFFLPVDLEASILSIPAIRPDRLVIHRVKWSDKALLQVLHQRLEAFSNYSSLDELCRPELRGRIEQEMLSLAKGSPRDLVRLGELLFSEQARLTETEGDPEISQEAWEAAKERFFEEKRYEWKMGEEVILSGAEQVAEREPKEAWAETLELVRTSFPAPIAMVCRAFLTERIPERRFMRMLHLFEVTMFFSVYLLIGIYTSLVSRGQTGLKSLSSSLRGLGVRGVTLGKLDDLFRRLIGILVQQRDGRDLQRLFQRFYTDRAATIKRFINLRNDYYAHTGLRNSISYEQILREYEPELIELFKSLSFLTDIKLVWVDHHKIQGKHKIHASKLCVGDNPLFRWWEFDAPVLLDCGKLWVIKGEDFARAIPLHPLVIMAPCEECGQEEIFFYNRYEKCGAKYTNYFSGHHLITDRYLAELLEFLQCK